MKIKFITSMNKRYFDHCGESMIKSFLSHNSHPLYVYNEDDFDLPTGAEALGYNLGNQWEQFKLRFGPKSSVRKFGNKAFSIIHAMNYLKADRIIWLDADTIFKKGFDKKIIKSLCPADSLSTHLSVWHTRDDIRYHSCETGFFVLNKKHSGFTDFKHEYENIYYNDKIEGLRRYYDGDVYGKVVNTMEDKGHSMTQLNKTTKKSPVPYSILEPYMSHYKSKGSKSKIDNNILKDRYKL